MDKLDTITEKEREALLLVADNLSSKEIARRLQVSPSAIDHRIDSARRKLGGIRRTEAARRVVRACDGLPCEPFPVPPSDDVQEAEGCRAAMFVGPAEQNVTWEKHLIFFDPAPRCEPRQLCGRERLGIILSLAVKTALLLMILVGMTADLERVLQE